MVFILQYQVFDECWQRRDGNSRFACYEVVPLGYNSIGFAIATVTPIALGGALQCIVAVVLTARRVPNSDPFKSLPRLVRLLVLVTSPLLLSPVILYVYGVYAVIRYGTTNNNIAKVKITAVIAYLKMAEIVLESMPQLITQLVAAFAVFSYRRINCPTM